jgi:hyperosmotically inducible protein
VITADAAAADAAAADAAAARGARRDVSLRRKAMKKIVLIGLLAATAAYLPVAYGDDSGDHHYVKDSVITTKVKAKLAAKHMHTLTHVKVDTDANGVVYLSGTVPTKDARDLAGMIAKDTDGVNSVNNDLEIAPN